MTIQEYAVQLKLPYIKIHSKELIDEAIHTKLSYEEFLEMYLSREYELRKNNGIKTRLRNAKFPIKKYLEDFDHSKYGKEFRDKFKELETLRFIENKENVILIGTPGSGNYQKKNIIERNEF